MDRGFLQLLLGYSDIGHLQEQELMERSRQLTEMKAQAETQAPAATAAAGRRRHSLDGA